MPTKMNFNALPDLADMIAEKRTQKWDRRDADPDPSLQMSVRLKASTYDTFKALCQKERYTHGEMIEILISEYLSKHGERLSPKKD
jgi:hypothetical protein